MAVAIHQTGPGKEWTRTTDMRRADSAPRGDMRGGEGDALHFVKIATDGFHGIIFRQRLTLAAFMLGSSRRGQ